ncbi:hypothetical protein P885DRAFT_42857 [Corynascus similis CBS 632.67]
MCQPPTKDVAREMLGPAISRDVSVSKVQPIHSDRPMRVHQVLLSDGNTLHLVLPPLPMRRPLRAEQDMLTYEAVTVRWIRETLARGDGFPEGLKASSSSPTTESDSVAALVLPLLPILLRHGQKNHLPDSSSFAVYEPTRGTSLSLLPTATQPTPAAQQDINRQLGTLFRSLATLTAPTGRFGPVAAVVAGGTTNTQERSHHHHRLGEGAAKLLKGLMEGGLAATGGAGTWSVAFHSMLEGALRDGEDMAVVIPYPTIRRHFRRLGYLLDDVTTGRLVVVEGAERGNVLVATAEGVAASTREAGEGNNGKDSGQQEGKDVESGKKAADTTNEEQRGPPELNQRGEANNQMGQQHQRQQSLNVTGLRDWSSAIFGDPLLATIFSDPVGHQQPPPPTFLEGFNAEKPDTGPDHHPQASSHLPYPLDGTILEGVDTAWVRLLLYQVYHTVTRIVGEFYRPRQDSGARELEARRKLNEVLAKLAEVPDDVKRRHRRPSGEMSPAKRPRSGDGEW